MTDRDLRRSSGPPKRPSDHPQRRPRDRASRPSFLGPSAEQRRRARESSVPPPRPPSALPPRRSDPPPRSLSAAPPPRHSGPPPRSLARPRGAPAHRRAIPPPAPPPASDNGKKGTIPQPYKNSLRLTELYHRRDHIFERNVDHDLEAERALTEVAQEAFKTYDAIEFSHVDTHLGEGRIITILGALYEPGMGKRFLVYTPETWTDSKVIQIPSGTLVAIKSSRDMRFYPPSSRRS